MRTPIAYFLILSSILFALGSAVALLPRGEDPERMAEVLVRARIARKVARLEPLTGAAGSH